MNILKRIFGNITKENQKTRIYPPVINPEVKTYRYKMMETLYVHTDEYYRTKLILVQDETSGLYGFYIYRYYNYTMTFPTTGYIITTPVKLDCKYTLKDVEILIEDRIIPLLKSKPIGELLPSTTNTNTNTIDIDILQILGYFG
jgi:hypothetical protein